MEPGTVDTGEDSETDQASQTAAAEGVAADTGSLFEDYPSLVPPTDDDDAAVAEPMLAISGVESVSGRSESGGALFENYTGGENGEDTSSRSVAENGEESTTLETPPPPPELEEEENSSDRRHRQHTAAVSAGESTEEDASAEALVPAGEQSEYGEEAAADNDRRSVDKAADAEESSDKPEAVEGAGEQGEAGGGSADQAAPWSAAEKEDEGEY